MTMDAKLRPFCILECSLLLVWRHKRAFAILLVVLWLFEGQLLSLIEAGDSPVSAIVTAYLHLEILRVVLVSGTYRATRERVLSMTELVRRAVDGESVVRALRVTAVVAAYTVFLLLCWLPLYELGVALQLSADEILMVTTLLWLAVEIPLFVLIPVAVLESRGLWDIFRRAARLTAGSRREILQLALMLGPGVVLPYALLVGAARPEFLLGEQAEVFEQMVPVFRRVVVGIAVIFASFMAVVTTVCYRGLLEERS